MRADDIEQPDHAQRPAADLGGEAAVDQVGWQVQGDEAELEAAGEEAEHEQDVGAMPEGLGQGLLVGLSLGRCRPRRRAGPAVELAQTA